MDNDPTTSLVEEIESLKAKFEALKRAVKPIVDQRAGRRIDRLITKPEYDRIVEAYTK